VMHAGSLNMLLPTYINMFIFGVRPRYPARISRILPAGAALVRMRGAHCEAQRRGVRRESHRHGVAALRPGARPDVESSFCRRI